MQKKSYIFSRKHLYRYAAYLQEQERAANTIQKYLHDLTALLDYLGGRPLTKTVLVEWKKELIHHYAPSSVNVMLSALNSFLSFMGWQGLAVHFLKIQKTIFCDERRELSREEYVRLVHTAERQGKEQLSLVLQTICSTGIRVSELRYITVEAVQIGRADISNKGKRRSIFLSEKLRRLLKSYTKKKQIHTGPVFVTRSGRPLDRSNIWRAMKALCSSAGVTPEKVFPHNLRHLFARTFYTLEKDLSRLADILGHSSINTTRIYTAESGLIHAKQIARMGLVIT